MRPGDILGETFEIERLAASGGMGEIYRAHHRASGEAVAIKVLLAQRSADDARFAREAEVLAELRHPGIVRYVAHGATPQGQLYLAMEWLEGEDLSRRLARGALRVDEALTLVTRVAEALAEAHASGVVHRDLKPSNLLLVGSDVARVKVLDFGIARLGGAATMTKTNAVIGTPGYMAPEQARGGKEVDARADVFALGCVLFECLTGAPAFRGDHVLAILAKVLFQEAPRPRELCPDVPAALDALVARMLSKDPNDRPRHGAAVAAALATLEAPVALAGEVSSRPPPSALTRSERRVRSVVLLGKTLPASAATESGATAEHLREAAAAHGGRLDVLVDGSAIVTLAHASRVATDQAPLAARCAIALHAIAPDRPIALATGRAEVTGTLPIGDAIDRAAQMLAKPASHTAIAVDDVTAGLLDARFKVVETEAGLELHGELDLAEGTRTLLGKPTACVGRNWELTTLESHLAECVEESLARAVLVTAPAGMGKSRLAFELIRRVRQRGEGAQVWIGRSDSLRAGSAFGLLGQALRSVFSIRDGEPIEIRRQRLCDRVARHVAPTERQRIAESLGELVGTPFPAEDSAPLRAARQNAQLMGEHMRWAWVDFLRAETGAHPVLLVLEDLHWGDVPTVRFIDAALQRLSDQPFMVLALARPAVHELFPKLWADRRMQEIRLKELSRKASERLVRQALGDSVRKATLDRLVTQAEGNAFYLEELVRAVAEGRGGALPETVVAMVQARLEGFNAEARRVLRAASVFGAVCWRGGVEALLGGAAQAAQTGEWLSMLAEREALLRRPESRFPGEQEFTFRHALLREGAYAMLTEEDRVLGHRLAGAWLVSHGENDPLMLAEQFACGKDAERAGIYYLRAVEQAHQGGAPDMAIATAERALSNDLPKDLRVALLGMLCMAYVHRPGALGEATPYIDEVLRTAAPGSAPWARAASAKLVGAMHLVQHDEFNATLDLVREVEPSPDATHPTTLALINGAYVLDARGQIDAAKSVLLRAHAIVEPVAQREPGTFGWLALMHAMREAYANDDPWSGLKWAEVAGAALKEANHHRGALQAQVYTGMNLWFLGSLERAEHELREGAGGDEKAGGVHRPLSLIGVLADRGALNAAQALAASVLELARERRHRLDEGRGRWVTAEVLRRKGELDEALREARAALELLSPVPLDRIAAAATLAAILLALGNAAEALAVAEDAAAKHAAMRGCGLFRGAFVRLVHAEVLHGAGHRERAGAAIAAAKERLGTIAGKIADSELRRSFLEVVPENARTLARAREWLGR